MTRKSNYNYLDEDNQEDEESPIGLGQSPSSVSFLADNNKKKNVKFNLDTPLPIIRDKSTSSSSSSSSSSQSSNRISKNNKLNISDYKDDEFEFKRSEYDFDDVDDLEDSFDEHSFYKTNYSTRRCIYRILTYIRPQIWYFVFAFLALAVTTLCQLSLPFYFAQGLQETVEGSAVNKINTTIIEENSNTTTAPIPPHLFTLLHIPYHDFKWYNLSKTIVIIILIQTPFLFIRYLLFTMAGFSIVTKVKRDLFKSLLTQEVSYFDSNRSGDLKAVISTDSTILQNCITVSLSTLVRCLLQLSGGLLILIFLSWKVTLLLTSFVFIIAFSYLVFNTKIYPKFIYIQDKLVNIGSIIDDSIGNIKEIRLLNAESKELRSFETELEALHRSSRSFVLLNAFWISMGSLLVMASIIVIYLFAISETLNPNDKLLLIQYILYTLMVTASLNGLIGSMNEIQKLISSSKRIFSLIDRKPIIHFQGGITPSSTETNITFDNVCFNQKPTCSSSSSSLLNVSFMVGKGQIVSLVGPSQSKELIFSLIQGLYYPTRGTLYIGRIDSKVLDLYFFRNHLFTISTHQSVIFDTTVEQNIRYGLSHLSQQNIIDASKKANLHDFVIGLPHGYDTMIGKNNLFDPIQILKISIARAFLRNPSVLLLDETTLPFGSNEIEQSLELLCQHKTVIVIANKLSTLKKSNQVLVFDDNKLIDKGTHNELSLKLNSLYVTTVLNNLSDK